MTGVIIAAAIVGGTGIIIGLFLGISGEKLKVEVDEKEVAVREALPGNNCGGCGYPGTWRRPPGRPPASPGARRPA